MNLNHPTQPTKTTKHPACASAAVGRLHLSPASRWLTDINTCNHPPLTANNGYYHLLKPANTN
jgi:hypothetical protein